MLQEPPSINATRTVIASMTPVRQRRRDGPPVAPCGHQEVNFREQCDRSSRGIPKTNYSSEPCGGISDVGGEFDNGRETYAEDSVESGMERVSVMGNSRADSACGSCASASEQTLDPENEGMDVRLVLKNLLDGQAWLAGVQGALQDMQLQVAAHVEEQLDKMMMRVEEQLHAHRLGWKVELAAEVHRQLANPPSGQTHAMQHECSMSPAMLPRGRPHDNTFASASRSLSSCGSSVSLLSSCVAAPLMSPGRDFQASGRASECAPLHEDASQPTKKSLEWQQDEPVWPTSKNDQFQDSATDVAALKLPNVFSVPPAAISGECSAPTGNSLLQPLEQPGAGEPRMWSQQQTRPSRAMSAPDFGGQESEEEEVPMGDYTRSCSPPGALSPCRSPRSPCLSPRHAASLENSCAKLNAALRVPRLALHTVSRAPDAQLQDILAWRRLKSEGQTDDRQMKRWTDNREICGNSGGELSTW
eukprot:CAMPEP_0172758544 /NCGR_PEP_ID=MMETSP1074-20121228/165938_1 /TAXON_ID=2916 /ORGANISM="Ceratium fusus, Strain PA161109" /LENGTH=473 /DNA_ID=CAMNT_0013592163 /DNA_START=19 /DNA_END=1441 /DNA_ORIENTATION=-